MKKSTILMDFNLDTIFEEPIGFIKIEKLEDCTIVVIVSENLYDIVHWQKVLEDNNDKISELGIIDESSFGFKIKNEVYERTIKIFHR